MLSPMFSRPSNSSRPLTLLFVLLSSLMGVVNGWLRDRLWTTGRLGLELDEAFVGADIGASRRDVVLCWPCLPGGLSWPGECGVGGVLLGAEVPSSRRDGQEGIDVQAELVHMQPNVAEYEFGGRRTGPLRG